MYPANMPRVYGRAFAEAQAAGERLVSVREFYYDSMTDYLDARDAGRGPFEVMQRLEQQQPGRRYRVVAEVHDFTDVPVAVPDHLSFRRFVMDNMTGGSDEADSVFNNDGRLGIMFELYRVEDQRAQGNPYQFMATGGRTRFWGPLGKVNNCVVRQISSRVEGYLANGDKRAYMWTPGGRRISADRTSPDYNAVAAKRLSQDKTYIKIKKGVAAFLRNRDCACEDSSGFDVRDMCELAELCDIRIFVWMRSRCCPVLRWDTNDKCRAMASVDKRYYFHFWMTGVQHLEMCTKSEVEANEGDPRALRSSAPGVVKVRYVDDEWFRSLYAVGFPPEADPFDPEHRRVYTITRSCLRWLLPDVAKACRYSDHLVAEGDTVYKHACYRGWLEDEGIDPEDPESYGLMCAADIHWQRLRAAYRVNNMGRVHQRKQPALFEAIAYADKVTTHTLTQPVPEGASLWDVDGRKWYATKFADIPDFPYFHGYPASDTWSEYNGRMSWPALDTSTGRFYPRDTCVGNMHEGDRPFTFGYGKYALFLVEELDLSGCEEHTLEHFRRDQLFVDFESGSSVLPIASPVLHFLQDLGAKWRASHLWMCYGCVDVWVVGGGPGDADELRAEMVDRKTYAICAGRLMAGRWPATTTTYITPDHVTARDLLAWHSSSFVGGDPSDVVYDRVPRKHSPQSLVYSEDADIYGARLMSGSTMSNGGYMLQKGDDRVDGVLPPPFMVTCTADMYGLGSTYAHVSGALHAMCFVRLYSAALRIPPEHVAGFSLDSIKCFVDPTGYLCGLISGSDDVQGTFKPAVYKPVSRVYRSRTPLLSPLYAPRGAFQGFSAPDKSRPLWGEYQDGLGQFNIVTGKAGSGKTWRHLRAHGPSDQRVDRLLYAPLTNYLAAQLKSQGIPSTTSFKAFNRRVDDAQTVRDARQRYVTDNSEQRNRVKGFAGILRDEVTMDSGSMILDAIRCCQENHMQLFLVGDFVRERFYQLSAVKEGGPEVMAMALQQAEKELGRKRIVWVPPQQVYRQTGDPELSALLDRLRDHSGSSGERWAVLEGSPLFERASYRDMLRQVDPEKDVVINPWHRNISEVTEYVLDRMAPEDRLVLHGNFTSRYKVKETDPEAVRSLAPFEGDPCAHKGVTCTIAKSELEALRDTKFMAKGYPYSGGSTDGNLVNPMIGATVFALRGVTLDPDATLWVLASSREAPEWCTDEQPCQAYVTLSRARSRGQIRVVVADRHSRRRLT